jgi:hypothetical protein
MKACGEANADWTSSAEKARTIVDDFIPAVVDCVVECDGVGLDTNDLCALGLYMYRS